MKTNLFMKTILIIDDEPDLCAFLKHMLTKEDFQVDCAHTLAEANVKLNMHPHPGVVLLDNNLPDGMGLDYMHSHPVEFAGSNVIMITADPAPSIREKAASEGISHFLQKPFSLSHVREMIDETPK